jgi:hypothetical protein
VIRVGVFYDGTFFYKLSNYFLNQSRFRARLSIEGLHDFVCDRISEFDPAPRPTVRIVDAHYFRGRLSAQEAADLSYLESDRSFDDVLMRAGVAMWYRPLGPQGEKGVDVALALEALDITMTRGLDVVVLVAGDADFVPLIKKLNARGTRVLLVSGHIEAANAGVGLSRALRAAVDYPVVLNEWLEQHVDFTGPPDAPLRLQDDVQKLFVGLRRPPGDPSTLMGKHLTGRLGSIKGSYGFIECVDADGLNCSVFVPRILPGFTVGSELEFTVSRSTHPDHLGKPLATELRLLNVGAPESAGESEGVMAAALRQVSAPPKGK